MHFYFFVLLITLLGQVSNAQYINPSCRYTSYGISGKLTYFDGDVKSPLPYINGGFGISVNRRITPRITLFSELSLFRIAGDDNKGSSLTDKATIPIYIRNLHFRNDIKQISIGLKYDFLPSNEHYRKRPLYNIYATAGVVFLYHNPKARVFKDSTFTNTKWINLRPLQTENRNYSNFQIAIPAGVGIRYKLSLQWDFELELTYQYHLSDYIDDVSTKYIDPSLLKDDKAKQLSNRSAETIAAGTKKQRDLNYIENTLERPIYSNGNYSYVEGAEPGSKRGTKTGNDGIILLSFRFLYTFPGKVNCPKYREL